MEIEVIPLIGPMRRLRIDVDLSMRVGQLIDKVSRDVGVSGSFFKIVGNGKVLDEAAEIGEVVKEVGSRLYFYPEVMGG